MPDGGAYLDDILHQPQALLDLDRHVAESGTLAAVRAEPTPPQVVLTGMGSSLAALRPAWMTLIAAGVPSWLVETGELLADVPGLLQRPGLVVVASQSGRSAEVVALLEQRRAGRLLAITNDPASPLAIAADIVVEIRAGAEHAVSTRSYVNTVAVAQLVAGALTGEDTAPAYAPVAAGIAAYLEDHERHVDDLKALVGLPERLFYLARGRSLAAAACGALIAKEAAKQPVEAMSSPQFRHGPLELADERLTVVMLAGTGADRERNLRLHGDLERLGATAVWADADADAGVAGPVLALAATPPLGLPIAEIVALQLLSIALAEQAGVPPGTFRHLDKVTTVE